MLQYIKYVKIDSKTINNFTFMFKKRLTKVINELLEEQIRILE